MITDSELRISNQSYTNKDFYQIYPEILELVNQITERWDPASSNESDPGVVLLKLLAFVADKGNYNIDKNILECFMPSATQEDSMRKLCDMMGYTMHYYKSAEADVSFMWSGSELVKFGEVSDKYIVIPAFSALTNEAQDINFVTTEDIKLTYRYETKSVPCIEGTYVQVVVNSDNIVKIDNIDDNKRFYMPEIMVPENGIWVKDATKDLLGREVGEYWTRVDNLNIQNSNTKVWKFCYDSKRKLPYIQFPEDVAEIIENGLYINYVRTSGVSGNVAAKVITQLSGATTVTLTSNDLTASSEEINISDDNRTYLTIQNPSATINGMDNESLDDAYNGFKHTVGSFETLVTCRDYANAIYNMTVSNVDTSTLVSNVQVSDIRNELNYANKIASFGDFGIVYNDVPVQESGVDKISHFDLLLYPLNPIQSSFKSDTYQNSFKPNSQYFYEIKNQLAEKKTISHKIDHPVMQLGSNDVYLIKNYYTLSGTVATNYKVTKFEGQQILNNIYTALYKKFNARQVDFGEELPYETILSTIEGADSRIKAVGLNDPVVVPYVMYGDGTEYPLINDAAQSGAPVNRGSCKAYWDLACKNILAGRIPLLNFDERFTYGYGQTATGQTVGSQSVDTIWGKAQTYAPIGLYEQASKPAAATVSNVPGLANTYLTTEVKMPKPVFATAAGYKLRTNEAVQIVAPNFKTTTTYPSYVNYHLISTAHVASNPIKSGSEYKLTGTDKLYINYTDSDSVVHSIKYTATEIWEATGEGSFVQKESGAENIIKPNFDFYDSVYWNSQQHAWAKKYDKLPQAIKGDADWPGPTAGMFSLGTTDQIEMRALSETSLKSPTYCYWVTENDNRLTFTNSGSAVTDPAVCILNDGEYFFYTDENKTTLVTLGSGTKLTRNHVTAASGQEIWELTTDSSLNVDDVASKGIGAFADVSWQYRRDITENNPLGIHEMQIINVAEGSTIKYENGTGLANGLDNSWQTISDPQHFFYDDTPLPTFDNLNITWQIRSRLNLNIGPTFTQTLSDYSDGTNTVTQSFKLYRTTWKHNENGTIKYGDPHLDNSGATVEIFSYYNIAEPMTESGYDTTLTPALPSPLVAGTYTLDLRCNVTEQRAGGELLSIRTFNTAAVETDEVLFYPFKQESVQGAGTAGTWEVITNVNNYSDKFTHFEFDTYKKIKLPVNIIDGDFGVIMIYLAKDPSTAGNAYLMTYESGSTAGESLLAKYDAESGGVRPWTPSSALLTNSITLTDGINVIYVKRSTATKYLYIDGTAAGKCSVVVADIDLVDNENSTNGSGINYDGIGITKTQCDTFLGYLSSKTSVSGAGQTFYYNLPVDNTITLDIETLADPLSWFNYNNIVNKFTIGELDTDFNLKIADSSKVNRW